MPAIKGGCVCYQEYNREERDLCAHLFRLLLLDQEKWWPLRDFLGIGREVDIGQPQVFCEVALIRDVFHAKKKQDGDGAREFMIKLTELVARKLRVASYTPFGKLLPEDLQDFDKTHPRQILMKLKKQDAPVTEYDEQVYEKIQSLFSAKPDLLVSCSGKFYVYEAKFCLGFTDSQLALTELIAKVWKEMLFNDLGYEQIPDYELRVLGLQENIESLNEKNQPAYQGSSWEAVRQIAQEFLPENDFSRMAIERRLAKACP